MLMSTQKIELSRETIEALQKGNKVAAVKSIRLTHNVSLDQAMEMIGQHELGEPDRHAHATTTIPTQAIVALQQGSKIDAIKAVREAQRTDLKTAKALVEEYIATNPHIASTMQAANAAQLKRIFRWLIVIGVAFSIAYIAGNH